MTRDELARLGAIVRLTQLREEMAGLEALVNGDSPEPVVTTGNTAVSRRRKPMSAKAKAAVSRRMKAYWKAKRAESK